MGTLSNLMSTDLIAVIRGRRRELTSTVKDRYWQAAEVYLAGKSSKSAKAATELEEIIEAAGYSLDDFEMHVALLRERAGLATLADSIPDFKMKAKDAAVLSGRRSAERNELRIREEEEWQAEWLELEKARSRTARDLEAAQLAASKMEELDRTISKARGDDPTEPEITDGDEESAPTRGGYQVILPAAASEARDQAAEVPVASVESEAASNHEAIKAEQEKTQAPQTQQMI